MQINQLSFGVHSAVSFFKMYVGLQPQFKTHSSMVELVVSHCQSTCSQIFQDKLIMVIIIV